MNRPNRHRAPALDAGSVRSVLVITKHHFMGDTIVAVPLLRAARAVFPGAHVTLLTGPAAAAALRHCPYVDRTVEYAPRKQKGLGSFRRLIGELRAHGRPDVCLVVDRSIRSAFVALCAGGRVRSGFDTEGRGPLLTHRVAYDPVQREAECCLDVLRAIVPEPAAGAPRYDASPELWASPEERERGAALLREHGASGVRLAGIQPGANYDRKQWRPEGFAAVADALVASGAASGIVLVGSGEREVEAADAMKAAMDPATPVCDLTGRTSLRETFGVVSHLSLFVGNDTGVTHIAASLGVPTVGLFGPTKASKWGNAGERGVVLTAPGGELADLDAAPVREAALRLLGASVSVAAAGGVA